MGGKFQVHYDQELGRGAFGVMVHRGTFSQVKVAVKSVPKALLSDGEKSQARLISHPNVIKVFYTEEIHHLRFYVLELCCATLHRCFSLEDNQEIYNGPLPSEIEGLLQMVSGLEYIHSKDIVHQNIKPQNILISFSLPVQLKLSEFRVTSAISEASKVWMAPEILEGIDETGVAVTALATPLSDVWSLGCVFFYFLLRGEHPFGEKNAVRIFNILEGNPYLLTEELITSAHYLWKLSLVADMVAKAPEERLQLIEIKKQLEFIVSYIHDLDESDCSPESLTDDGSSLLHFAAQLKSRTAPPLMAEFLSRTKHINVQDKQGRTPLDVVAGNTSQWAPVLTQQLLQRGGRYSQSPSLSDVDHLTLSALYAAHMKKQLLENVRNVCIKDSEGYEWL